jgi:Family of unknown function (DUF5677)
LLGPLYGRTLTNLQTSALLISFGLERQARAMFRVALESLMTFVAITKSETFAEQYTVADEDYRKKMFNKSVLLGKIDPSYVPAQQATQLLEKEIQEEVARLKAREMKVFEVAKVAEMENWYLSVYALFSSSVHTNVRDIEQHLVLDSNDNISGIINEPVVEDLSGMFLVVCEGMLKLLIDTSTYFSLDLSAFVENQYAALSNLSERENLINSDNPH